MSRSQRRFYRGELQRYAKMRKVRIISHGTITARNIECARDLIDEFVILAPSRPGLSVDFCHCPEHNLSILLSNR